MAAAMRGAVAMSELLRSLLISWAILIAGIIALAFAHAIPTAPRDDEQKDKRR